MAKKQGHIRACSPHEIPLIIILDPLNVVVIRVCARPPAPLPGMCRGYIVRRHSTTAYTSACAAKERKVTRPSSRLPPRYSLEQGLAQVWVLALWLHYLLLPELSSFYREPLPVVF